MSREDAPAGSPWPSMLFNAVVAGAVGAGMAWFLIQQVREEVAMRPPVVVVDLADLALNASGDAAAHVDRIREQVKKLRDAGYLVLDGQSVLGAPDDLFVRRPPVPVTAAPALPAAVATRGLALPAGEPK